MIYYCIVCGYEHEGDNPPEKCPQCGCPATKVFIDMRKRLSQISTSESFINGMIKLYQENPIEYQLKMAQFKTQLEQTKQLQNNKPETTNQPKCPTCGSTNIEKISIKQKAVGGVLFGLFSSNVRKTMHCKNCGYKW